MEGFFTWLIIFALVALYSVLLLALYKHHYLENCVPDAILHFSKQDDVQKGNFLLLLPIDEVLKRKMIFVEIQNELEPDSQEKQGA